MKLKTEKQLDVNSGFSTNNHDRLVRLEEVLKIVPVSRSSWWDGVRKGRYPKSLKLGPRTTCWRLSEVLEIVAGGR